MSRPVAVVLGAGMGGRGVARALAVGHDVIVVDRSMELAGQVADSVHGEAAVVDLLDVDDVQRFVDEVLKSKGHIDAVIHLVGGWKGSPSVDREALAAWDAIAPGVFGTVRTTSVVFRDALIDSGGVYLMVTSTAAARPTAGNVAYATAKSAAETWVTGLAHSFRDCSARAVIVAVKALVDSSMRTANPDNPYAGYTDTDELGRAIAGILGDDSTPNGARCDLTEE